MSRGPWADKSVQERDKMRTASAHPLNPGARFSPSSGGYGVGEDALRAFEKGRGGSGGRGLFAGLRSELDFSLSMGLPVETVLARWVKKLTNSGDPEAVAIQKVSREYDKWEKRRQEGPVGSEFRPNLEPDEED